MLLLNCWIRDRDRREQGLRIGVIRRLIDGIGRADLITRKVYDKLDRHATYTNTITATFLERAKIPIAIDTEKEAFEVGLKTIWNLPGTVPRVMIIKNTLKLDELYVSEPIWEDIKDQPNIKAAGEWEPMGFDSKGELLLRIL